MPLLPLNYPLLSQEYYQQVESIEELKRSVQFPKLENLPSDFLTQMEGYVKEAPQRVDTRTSEVVSKKVNCDCCQATKIYLALPAPRQKISASDFVFLCTSHLNM